MGAVAARSRPAPRILPLLVVAVALAALFVLVPRIDLWAARLFWRPGVGFWLGDTAFAQIFYRGIPIVRNWIVIPVTAILLVLAAVRRLPFGIPPRAVVLFAATLTLGSALLVNEVLKNHWGRARPREVAEFGGPREFTPAFVPADQCARNCSFVSGHPSLFFTFFALALLARRRRLATAGVAFLGGLAGLGRMMQGAHFLSDVLFSGILMYLVAWGLYALLYRGPPE